MPPEGGYFMKITPVESSTLASVGYDESSDLLQLEFRSRAIYRYFEVPTAVHEALLAATSKGSYFNQAIRGRYRFVRVGMPASGASSPVRSASQRGAAWPAR
jgi:KTSC domain-containing protein